MKTTIFSIYAIIFFYSGLVAQNIELTFSANYNNQHIQLDSIYIKNLSQANDTVLYYPDTVLIIANVGIYELESSKQNLTVTQNYPNPFTSHTSVSVYLPENELISVCVFDILGRKLATYEDHLQAGSHMFTFYPCSESFYLLSVATKHDIKTIKMLGYGNKINLNCKLSYIGMTDYNRTIKANKSYFVFSDGDYLSYIGYATITGNKGSGFINDNPVNNQTYVFDIGEDGIPCPDMPTVTDIDGNVYQTVRIGSQCWMKENLKTTKYSDGTPIYYPESYNYGWDSDTLGAYAWFANDMTNGYYYGALYNWYAVTNPLGLCPPGWHVPTDEEWCILENYIERYTDPFCNIVSNNERGKNTARILKSCLTTPGQGVPPECEAIQHPVWDYSGEDYYGYDTYGFSATPGGGRTNMLYSGRGFHGYWWTSSESSEYFYPVLIRRMEKGDNYVKRSATAKNRGLSVRCVKN